jgi:hypothetical protein
MWLPPGVTPEVIVRGWCRALHQRRLNDRPVACAQEVKAIRGRQHLYNTLFHALKRRHNWPAPRMADRTATSGAVDAVWRAAAIEVGLPGVDPLPKAPRVRAPRALPRVDRKLIEGIEARHICGWCCEAIGPERLGRARWCCNSCQSSASRALRDAERRGGVEVRALVVALEEQLGWPRKEALHTSEARLWADVPSVYEPDGRIQRSLRWRRCANPECRDLMPAAKCGAKACTRECSRRVPRRKQRSRASEDAVTKTAGGPPRSSVIGHATFSTTEVVQDFRVRPIRAPRLSRQCVLIATPVLALPVQRERVARSPPCDALPVQRERVARSPPCDQPS